MLANGVDSRQQLCNLGTSNDLLALGSDQSRRLRRIDASSQAWALRDFLELVKKRLADDDKELASPPCLRVDDDSWLHASRAALRTACTSRSMSASVTSSTGARAASCAIRSLKKSVQR
jgi:hypothetical protein